MIIQVKLKKKVCVLCVLYYQTLSNFLYLIIPFFYHPIDNGTPSDNFTMCLPAIEF